MVLGLSVELFAACLAVVFLGAVVQGTIGIGLGMIAAPLLALVDRELVPVGILVSVIPLTIAMTLRERGGIDRRGVGLALVGRVPGVAVGAWAVAVADDALLALLVAGTVLAAVAVSMSTLRFRTTPTSVVAAGVASGFMGTSTGVGGPPMALTYQHADPAVMRSTLAAYFTVGSLISLAGLAMSNAVSVRQWQLGAALIPASIVGFAVSQVFAARLRGDRVRPFVLALCAASAIALLAEEFL